MKIQLYKPCWGHLRLFALVFFIACKGQVEEKTTEHEYTNALISETSPYLLQHAHNPVDWRPWSEEALEDAKKEDKLLLISIGYSSCHWCHVMEEETFEDEEVAALMNENFVSIKIDREERPDIDHIYQTFVQLIDQNSGWPLNIIALPNGKPLYGGTYHTKKQWSEVLAKIHQLYKDSPEKANEYADMVATGVQEANIVSPQNDTKGISPDLLAEAVDIWRANWDFEWGGDKGPEKFMLPINLTFLLDYALLTGDEQAKAHVKNTLDKIALGGVYDHVGGGFFRYSTDGQWKVPHFEKMLYDNAQLLSLYAKAYQVFKDPDYYKVVLETIEFLEREMYNGEGGFYAAIDADSEGEEGKFYVWKADELKDILQDDFRLFSEYYNIRPETVWENDNYVLYKEVENVDFAKSNNVSESDMANAGSRWKKSLLDQRMTRVRPSIDDKIITSWNALLINGYLDAHKAFGNTEFLDKAKEIFGYLRQNNYQEKELVHAFKKGSKRNTGFVEDYAFVIDAALSLYGVTLEEVYLDFAYELQETAQKDFFDQASKMFHFNKGHELISRIIKTNDGVLPSPNAIMAGNLLKLGHIGYDLELIEGSEVMLANMAGVMQTDLAGFAKWGQLSMAFTHPYFEVAVVGDQALSLVTAFNENYIPNAIVVGSAEPSNLPLFKDRFDEESTFIYVCQNSTCKLPVKTVAEAIDQMANF
ncbi:thioredoxin domain-containing protein [Maribacter algicola]|uniref:Thioredoxin domain-containing protein n=1 Tax=Meishania litoralis TaxID=3434685 RepID=A0ACC7LMI4_9FLAO